MSKHPPKSPFAPFYREAEAAIEENRTTRLEAYIGVTVLLFIAIITLASMVPWAKALKTLGLYGWGLG